MTALLARYQAGDVGAFSEIYRRYAPSVRAVCRRRLNDYHRAEDAVQETFARALPALLTFRGDGVERWLRRVARNHCIDLLRGGGREATLPDDTALWKDAAAETAFDRVVARAAVEQVIGQLQSRDQSMLVRHHVEGLTLDELAGEYGMTTGAVAVALHRARRRARQHGDVRLLGGVPLLLGHLRARLPNWARWFSGADVPTSLAQATAHLAIAVTMAAPVVLGSAPAFAEPARLPVLARTLSPGVLEHSDRSVRGAGQDAHLPAGGGGAKPQQAQLARSQRGRAESSGSTQKAVDLPEATVPGTDVKVHQQRPANRQARVGARLTPNGGAAEDVWVESYEEPAIEPAEVAACNALDAADTPLYCEP